MSVAWEIEVLNKTAKRGAFRFAVFDFDGTISLIRQGWQSVMKEYFLEELGRYAGEDEKTEEIIECISDFVDYNTGKQTIYQCISLCDEIKKRGRCPKEPLDYKEEYHSRLLEKINYRLDGIRSGELNGADWVVPGSYALLDALRERGLDLYLTSGTDEKYVLDESRLLNVDGYFKGIYGAQDDYKNFSKKIVIERIVSENELSGPELIGFGDGYVEIENIRESGGFTVGVASDELNREGMDEWKRKRLSKAGSDILIPDFSETDTLMDYLFYPEIKEKTDAV
jgi:phosphoglycolate phosphatase-like HAD superfamily hydrolase